MIQKGNVAKKLPYSTWYAIAVARILLGFMFLWSFLDKLFGLNRTTPSDLAWVHSGSPTKMFLLSVRGPFSSFFHALAGQTWVDWLFMLALVGLGLTLIFGIFVRFATAAGTVLLSMTWAASLPLAANPVIDEHVIYITLLWIINLAYADQVLSVAPWWRNTRLGRSSWLW